MKLVYCLLTLIVIFSLCFCGCGERPATEAQKQQPTSLTAQYGEDWTLEMTLENVTPTGATVVFTHKGDGVNITTGEPYFLEKYENGEWIGLETLGDAFFHAIGYMVPNNGSFTLDTSWEHLYGTLSEGRYRIGKNVRSEGVRTNEYKGVERIENYTEDTVYYAEFNI